MLRLSCPGTPDQNSIVKRKHRHIVELGLAMMYQARMPKCFWVDAFSTAIFLINHLPSPLLKMQCPYNILFKRKPVYSALRVFGSKCFPYLRNYATTKFEPGSFPCIFLGYSEKHKGYRCPHCSTGRVYISCHVVFNEK